MRSPTSSPRRVTTSTAAVDERQARALDSGLAGLPMETVQRYVLLLDELCRGLGVSKHEQFGSLRLHAGSETSGEILECTLEAPRERVRTRGHPDLR